MPGVRCDPVCSWQRKICRSKTSNVSKLDFPNLPFCRQSCALVPYLSPTSPLLVLYYTFSDSDPQGFQPIWLRFPKKLLKYLILSPKTIENNRILHTHMYIYIYLLICGEQHATERHSVPIWFIETTRCCRQSTYNRTDLCNRRPAFRNSRASRPVYCYQLCPIMEAEYPNSTSQPKRTKTTSY